MGVIENQEKGVSNQKKETQLCSCHIIEVCGRCFSYVLVSKLKFVGDAECDNLSAITEYGKNH